MLSSHLTAVKKVPIYAFFELTRRCNLSCLHCYAVKEKRKELTTHQVLDAVDQLKLENCLILNFSGGEVFIRKDFFEIARYAKKRNFAIKIFTNGTLIDKASAREIARLKPLRVEITIFSTESKVHDDITGINGSLKRSLRALELLKRYGVPLRIKSTLMAKNISGYSNIIKLAKELGAKYQFDPTVMPRADGSKDSLRSRVDQKALARVFNDPDIRIKEDVVRSDSAKNQDAFPCSAGHNSCAISAYGDVFPCVILPIKLGNITTKSFSDIWNSSRSLQEFRAIKIKDLKYCSGCNLLSGCRRCPGLAYLEHGNILGRSSRACEIAEIMSKIKG